jgi:hypothetical protein
MPVKPPPVVAKAGELGQDAAKAAASQVFDGSTPDEASQRVRPARSSARRRLPAGSAGRPCLLPGRAAPASAAGGPACFHAGL